MDAEHINTISKQLGVVSQFGSQTVNDMHYVFE